MLPNDICRVDDDYADPESDICKMPTLEDDELYEDEFSWEVYINGDK